MNELAAGVSIYLTRWTGKSRIPIHPKHLVENPEHRWYLDFINTNYTIADLGCANGAQTIEMARKGAAVVGFSLSLYKSLISWKISQAQKNPGDTTGWRIICEKI